MMKIFKRNKIIRLIVILLFASIISTFYSTNISASSSKYVKSLTVSSKVTLSEGDNKNVTVKLKVVNKASKKLNVKIKDKGIAKASYNTKKSKLTIIGVKAGNTKITLTTNAKNKKGKKIKKTINVTVTAKQKGYTFRYPSYLTEHFEKHGAEMGYKTEAEYLAGANAVINNPNALHKLEAEDNDHVYYIEATNEIVFLSQDGYIRTYFICSGKDYYDRQ